MSNSNPISIPTSYDFVAPRSIVFGWGRRREAGRLARPLGKRAFLVCGSKVLAKNGTLEDLKCLLGEAGVEAIPLATIGHEPEVQDVDQAVADLAGLGGGAGDFLLAIGGGSALDLAKAAAALATNRGSPTVRDYLEGVGRGLKITHPPLPLMALPTTAGTGAEVTKNAVISSYDPPFKKSLRSDGMMPAVVLVDPELTVSVPAKVTIQTGMDAITQLLESYLSRRARPIPQALCLQGLPLALGAITKAVEDGTNQEARTQMAHAALLSGLALANSGLGLAHGVAAALGVHCRVPHGLACAVMLPAALRVNREVRRAEMAYLAGLLLEDRFPSEETGAEALIGLMVGLCQRLGIPQRLSELGVRHNHLPDLVHSSHGNSLDGNPRDLSDEELFRLLEGMR